MNPKLYIPFILILTCFSCDKENVSPNDSFLIVGDTTDCLYYKFPNGLYFGSDTGLLNINLDSKSELRFKIISVFIDDCDEFYENCDSTEICDCWPTVYMDYVIDLFNNTDIAINKDSTYLELHELDTISANSIWSPYLKFPFLRSYPDDLGWDQLGEFYIGFRNTNQDTTYTWLKMELVNARFLVKSLATKLN
jgi:hypothetical protein